MGKALASFSQKYRKNPAWYWLEATVLLFPILPEYVSPFILFIGFIVFKVQWKKEGRKAKLGTIGKIEVIFMLLALVSVFWSSTKLDTLATAGLWWGMFLVQIMIYNLCFTKHRIKRILHLAVYGGVANSVVAIIQILTYLLNKHGFIADSLVLVTPFYKAIDKAVYTWLPFEISTSTFSDRASGFFSNPNLLCTYLLFIYAIAIYQFLNARSKKEYVIYFIFNLLICGGISSTLTRAGCILALAGWIIMFVCLFKRHKKQLLAVVVPTVVIIVPSILARYGIFDSVKTGEAISQTTNGATAIKSSTAHFQIWESVLDYITSNVKTLLIGMGFGCESTGTMLLENYNLDKPHAHNFVLEIWAEIGIVGVVILFIVIFTAVGKLLEIRTDTGRRLDMVFCMLTSMVLVFAFGLTDFIFNSPKQIIIFMMLMGITQAISACYDKTLIKRPSDLLHAAEEDIEHATHLTE